MITAKPESQRTVIRAEHLAIGYPGVVIQSGLDFSVQAGEIFVILGGSGCGKSTLLKTMIDLNAPLSGQITIQDRDLHQSGGRARQEILNEMGVMYQSGALFGSMNLLENVSLPLAEFTDLPAAAREIIALQKLQMTGLVEFSRHYPDEISGGMQKRAAIARAMALEPQILFLDEPSAGLDPVTASELDQLIVDLSRNLGLTFVIVTHELHSIMHIADRAIMLGKKGGGILASGHPLQMAQNRHLAEVANFFKPWLDLNMNRT
ncbi:MAG: ATP-binding cassette domain-containing protein [Leptospiraceae bacterium]|nr:ATP-binding cassette domain-containing protein [Leptospiraceae bacterium]